MQDDITREIPLAKGMVTIVDAEDYERVRQHRWHVTYRGPRKLPYVVRTVSDATGRRYELRLHRFILDLPQTGLDVDHRNGNTLDNRKLNLRPASRQQNSMNRGPQQNNKSGYKGVPVRVGNAGWVAQLGYRKTKFYLGTFDTPEAAARAYDVKAKELFGEFAYLNFPDDKCEFRDDEELEDKNSG